MPSAPSTPSCARPTTSPTTRAFPANSAAVNLEQWLAAWRSASQTGATPAIRFLSPCAMRPSASTFRSACSMNSSPAPRWISNADPGRRARHLRHLRRSLPLLLSRRIGGRPGLHPHLRLHRSRAQKNSPKKPASPFSSPTSCATWPKTRSASRVYLPLEDLAAHNVSLDSLLHRAQGNAAHRERARSAGRDRRSAQRTTTVGRQAAAAHRSREPACAVGAGADLSRACSSGFDARTTTCFRAASASRPSRSSKSWQSEWPALP